MSSPLLHLPLLHLPPLHSSAITMMLSAIVINPFTIVLGVSLLISIFKHLYGRQSCRTAANLVNMAGVPAVSSTTERNTSESKPPDSHLWPYLIKYLLVRNNSILYTQYSTVLLKDGTVVEVKSTAQVAHALLHDASVKQRTYADALSSAGAVLALNQALVDPRMYTILSSFRTCTDTYPAVVVKCRKWSSALHLVDWLGSAGLVRTFVGDRCFYI